MVEIVASWYLWLIWPDVQIFGDSPSAVDREDRFDGTSVENAAEKVLQSYKSQDDTCESFVEVGSVPQSHGWGHSHCIRATTYLFQGVAGLAVPSVSFIAAGWTKG